ncbi:MAG: hypothetical protein Q8942_12635 [Bacillota bacterium]|nr:hypothetical protein [Bacillota bacterium]
MDKKKLLKLIKVFFVLFILSGIGSIIDYYYGVFPHMFKGFSETYDLIRINNVSVKMPGAPFILIIITILVFVFLVKRFYKSIEAEIRKES